MSISVRSSVATLSPYVPPWLGLDRRHYMRLDMNENTLAPPTVVQEALQTFLAQGNLQMYPDYGWFLEKLSHYTGVNAANSIVTNGSDQAIEIILRAFLEPGDGIVIARPEFPIFSHVATLLGATVQGVPFEEDFSFPLQRLLQAVDKKTKLIALINPNNPTGTAISSADIVEILQQHPNLPVIVDEAYFEFTGNTVLEYLQNQPNLIITRTFSKAFAMAGLRLGYILAHENLISEFYKIRGPFDVNSCALHAANAQIDAPEGWQHYVNEVMQHSKPLVEHYFTDRKVDHVCGSANFMLVKPKDRDNAVQHLKNQGILVRPMVAPMIANTFRLSISTLTEMQQFTKAFDACLA